ncbi:MAG TPA: GAF domain-containing protein [Burkholderiales bacterium]|nr:GAF domain-containing protein [Burkholderiales bacterium]
MTERLDGLLAAHKGPAFLVDARSRRIVAANEAAAHAYGYQRESLEGLPIESLWPAAPAALHRPPAGGLRISRHRRRNGGAIDVEVTVLGAPRRRRMIGLAMNQVSERAFSLALIESRSRVLEQLSHGASLEAVLRSLVLAIEELSGDMLGSVLLLAQDGVHVRHGAAPSLPRTYWNAIDGLRIGPAAGSCGTAMYSGRQVIVADIATDPLWRSYRKLALGNGLRACWSTPIVSPAGVLGAFALYYLEPRQPREQEKQLVEVAAELAAIAIGHRQAQTAGDAVAPGARLSARELQIVRLIAQGEPVKRIAAGLRITISTVYTHRARIFDKLQIDSNVDLARYAVTHRLVH